MNSQLKSYFYFTVIVAAILAMMGLLQGSADAATDVQPSPVLFSNLSIDDGKNDTRQKNLHLFVTGSKIDQYENGRQHGNDDDAGVDRQRPHLYASSVFQSFVDIKASE
jgi:hypothetical protein